MNIGQLLTYWTTKGLVVESELLYEGRSHSGNEFKVYHYSVTKKHIGNFAELVVKTNFYGEPTRLIHATIFHDLIGSGTPRAFIENANLGKLEDYVG